MHEYSNKRAPSSTLQSSVTTTSVTERKKHLENNDDQDDQQLPENSSDTESEVVSKEPFKMEIVWRNVFLFVGLHIGAACGIYCAIFTAKWQTNLLGENPGAWLTRSPRSAKSRLNTRLEETRGWTRQLESLSDKRSALSRSSDDEEPDSSRTMHE